MPRKPTRLTILGAFATIAVALLTFAAGTREQSMHGSSGGIRYGLMPDGKWHRTASNLATSAFDFSWHTEVIRGRGWEKWTTSQSSTLVLGPDPRLSAVQAESLRWSVWQDDVDFLNENPQWPDHEFILTGAEMLRDRVGSRVIGATYYTRQFAMWIGAIAGVVALFMGIERTRARLRARSVLDNVSSGLCGRCKYPILDAPADRRVCSECGADISADVSNAEKVLGRV